MKRLSSILAMFLCLVMLCSTLAACKKSTNDPVDNSSTEQPTESAVRTDENGYVADDLPDSYDWQDVDFNILAWNEMKGWEWCEELTEDSTSVDKVLYDRMVEVEDRFHVVLNLTYENGNWDHRAAFIQKLEATKEAGIPYDLVSQYSHAAGEAAMKKLYVDLNTTDYVDLDKPWWPESINETATIGDKLYFATGDITPTLIRNVHCMYVNLDMFDAYGISSAYGGRSIYQIVKDGDWTIATMEEMAINKTDPVNGTYGITFTNDVALDAFYFGAGFRMVENNNGVLELSADLVNSTMIDYYDRMKSIYHNDNVIDQDSDKMSLFHNNKSFVHSGTIADAQLYTKNEIEFTLLPMPKLNTDQTEYYTVANYWVSMYGIPVNAADYTMSGMIMEGLASEGHRAVKDKIYFDLFQARFMAVPEKAEMLDMVSASVVFDSGRTFGTSIGSLWADFRNGITRNDEWSTIYGRESDTWVKKVADIFVALG